jgi:hypothetical protein
MINTINFNDLSAMLLDFVDGSDGFLYLRMVGPETTVGAIWAKLSARDGRGQKWGSEVRIPRPGRHYPDYVAAQKHITYRTLRTRLPSGMVDLALIHPALTVAEDNQRGFHLLTYAEGLPPGFFERLNQTLSISLKPEWSTWLWAQGQQTQAFPVIEIKSEYEGGQYVDKAYLTETTQTPISRLTSLGQAACYTVQCQGRYKQAWLQIIRQQLGLGIRLAKVPLSPGGCQYLNGSWGAHPSAEGWTLRHDNQVIAQAPTVNHLLTEARETLGVHFIIES